MSTFPREGDARCTDCGHHPSMCCCHGRWDATKVKDQKALRAHLGRDVSRPCWSCGQGTSCDVEFYAKCSESLPANLAIRKADDGTVHIRKLTDETPDEYHQRMDRINDEAIATMADDELRFGRCVKHGCLQHGGTCLPCAEEKIVTDRVLQVASQIKANNLRRKKAAKS